MGKPSLTLRKHLESAYNAFFRGDYEHAGLQFWNVYESAHQAGRKEYILMSLRMFSSCHDVRGSPEDAVQYLENAALFFPETHIFLPSDGSLSVYVGGQHDGYTDIKRGFYQIEYVRHKQCMQSAQLQSYAMVRADVSEYTRMPTQASKIVESCTLLSTSLQVQFHLNTFQFVDNGSTLERYGRAAAQVFDTPEEEVLKEISRMRIEGYYLIGRSQALLRRCILPVSVQTIASAFQDFVWSRTSDKYTYLTHLYNYCEEIVRRRYQEIAHEAAYGLLLGGICGDSKDDLVYDTVVLEGVAILQKLRYLEGIISKKDDSFKDVDSTPRLLRQYISAGMFDKAEQVCVDAALSRKKAFHGRIVKEAKKVVQSQRTDWNILVSEQKHIFQNSKCEGFEFDEILYQICSLLYIQCTPKEQESQLDVCDRVIEHSSFFLTMKLTCTVQMLSICICIALICKEQGKQDVQTLRTWKDMCGNEDTYDIKERMSVCISVLCRLNEFTIAAQFVQYIGSSTNNNTSSSSSSSSSNANSNKHPSTLYISYFSSLPSLQPGCVGMAPIDASTKQTVYNAQQEGGSLLGTFFNSLLHVENVTNSSYKEGLPFIERASTFIQGKPNLSSLVNEKYTPWFVKPTASQQQTQYASTQRRLLDDSDSDSEEEDEVILSDGEHSIKYSYEHYENSEHDEIDVIEEIDHSKIESKKKIHVNPANHGQYVYDNNMESKEHSKMQYDEMYTQHDTQEKPKNRFSNNNNNNNNNNNRSIYDDEIEASMTHRRPTEPSYKVTPLGSSGGYFGATGRLFQNLVVQPRTVQKTRSRTTTHTNTYTRTKRAPSKKQSPWAQVDTSWYHGSTKRMNTSVQNIQNIQPYNYQVYKTSNVNYKDSNKYNTIKHTHTNPSTQTNTSYPKYSSHNIPSHKSIYKYEESHSTTDTDSMSVQSQEIPIEPLPVTQLEAPLVNSMNYYTVDTPISDMYQEVHSDAPDFDQLSQLLRKQGVQ